MLVTTTNKLLLQHRHSSNLSHHLIYPHPKTRILYYYIDNTNQKRSKRLTGTAKFQLSILSSPFLRYSRPNGGLRDRSSLTLTSSREYRWYAPIPSSNIMYQRAARSMNASLRKWHISLLLRGPPQYLIARTGTKYQLPSVTNLNRSSSHVTPIDNFTLRCRPNCSKSGSGSSLLSSLSLVVPSYPPYSFPLVRRAPTVVFSIRHW